MDDMKQLHRQQVGTAITTLRRNRGYTLREFAVMVNVNHAHLWNIEHGRVGVTIDVLGKIAEGLEVRVSDLIDF